MSHSHLSSAVTTLLTFTSLPASLLAQQNILASTKHAASEFKSYTYSAAPSCQTLSMPLVTFAVVFILPGIAKVTALS